MTDEMEAKAENCRLAMKAALEAIQDYCGAEPTYEFSFPDEVYELATSDKGFGMRIDDVDDHDWTKDQAREMFRGLPRRPGTEEQEKRYQDSKSFLLARRIVLLTEDYDRAEAERKYAKWYATTLD